MALGTASSLDDFNPGTALGNRKSAAAETSAYNAALPGYESTLESDIANNNFAGAWQFAESHPENNAALAESQANAGGVFASQFDPLTSLLETSKGLTELDPSKQWTPAEISAFYNAAGQNWHQQGALGQNPEAALWGKNPIGGGDAATNAATTGTAAPDLARFAGTQQSSSFLDKYGADIAMLVAAVVAPEAIGVIEGGLEAGAVAAVGADSAAEFAGGALAGGGIAEGVTAGALWGAGSGAAIDAITGKPITGRGELLAAAAGGVGQGLSVAGRELGLNAIEAGALKGGASSAISGGNIATGALTGAVGAGIADSLGGGYLGGVAGGLAKAEVGNLVGGSNVATGLGSPTAPSGLNPILASGAGAATDAAGATPSWSDTLLGAAPFAAAGAAGTALASSARNENNALASQEEGLGKNPTAAGNALLGQFQSGTLSPLASQALNTSTAAGNTLITAAAPMNAIAQTAFGNYQNGTLNAADSMQLNNFVQSAQQQWLAANGGNADTGARAAAFAQIDAQATMLKQQLMTNELGVGNAEEAQWLSQTAQGQQTIIAGQQAAITSLNQTFTQAMSALGLGMEPIMAGINQAIQNNTQFGNQVTQLFTGLGTAYALAMSKGGGAGLTSALTGGIKSLLGGSSGGGPSAPSGLRGGGPNADVAGGSALGDPGPMIDPSQVTAPDLSSTDIIDLGDGS
jgi:hypothetical protein